jgi:hypothetical protein
MYICDMVHVSTNINIYILKFYLEHGTNIHYGPNDVVPSFLCSLDIKY